MLKEKRKRGNNPQQECINHIHNSTFMHSWDEKKRKRERLENREKDKNKPVDQNWSLIRKKKKKLVKLRYVTSSRIKPYLGEKGITGE